MGKGILLEICRRKAVVLTPQGEFLEVPLPPGPLEIGAEIQYAEPRKSPWVRWRLPIAAAVLLLLLVPLGYNFWTLTQPVAMVSVDINPSVVLTINKKDQVLRAEGQNEAGQAVLETVRWRFRSAEQVVAAITGEAIKEKKLDPSDQAGCVVLAVSTATDQELPPEQVDQIRERLTAAVAQAIGEQAKARKVEARAQVSGLEASLQTRIEAQKQGLTPGKLMLLQKIQETLPEVSPEDLRNKGPGKLLDELDINPSTIFGEGNGVQNQGKDAKGPPDGVPGSQNKGRGSEQSATAPGKSQGKGQGNGQGNPNQGVPGGKQEPGPPAKNDKPSRGSEKRSLPTPSNPVRIGVGRSLSSAQVGAAGGLYVVTGDTLWRQTAPGETVTLTLSGGSIQVSGVAEPLTGPVRLVPVGYSDGGAVIASGQVPAVPSNPILWRGRPYRGQIEVRRNNTDGRLSVVNVVNLEEYLLGVVPREMNASFPLEALKAQAVAARTYAATNLSWSKFAGEGFQMTDTVESQVYGGIWSESYRSNLAVVETRSRVVTYGGRYASTLFHASSGGHTENNEIIFNSSAVPYLRGVPDYDNVAGNPHYSWSVRFSAADLASKFSVGNVTSVTPSYRGASGRYRQWTFTGTKGSETLYRQDIRWRLGLKSTPRSVTVNGGGIVVKGGGWGHGVGMSQWGARGMADLGKSYIQILKHYYTGTEVGWL